MLARLALADEEDAYVDLARMAHEESRPYLTFSEAKVRSVFRRYLETAHPTIFVVERQREIIGFMNATISEFDSADGLFTTQEVMFVRPDRRGTRAAALLLRNFVRWSDQLGAIESTGGNDNAFHSEQTRRLLKRFGFAEVGFFMRRARGANGQEGRL